MAEKRYKIIIFENDQRRVAMYLSHLKKAGFLVVNMSFPPDNVVQIMLKEKPDLITTGIHMPHMDGLVLIKKLKGDSRTKSIPLFILTNHEMNADIHQGLYLGADDYYVMASHLPSEVAQKFKLFISDRKKYVPNFRQELKRSEKPVREPATNSSKVIQGKSGKLLFFLMILGVVVGVIIIAFLIMKNSW